MGLVLHDYWHPFKAEIFTVASKLKARVCTPSVLHAWARLQGVNNVFSHQFGIFAHPDAWIMLDELKGANAVYFSCLRECFCWRICCSAEVDRIRIPVPAERVGLVAAFGVYWRWHPACWASVAGKMSPPEWSPTCCGLNSAYVGWSFSAVTTKKNREMYCPLACHLFFRF